MPLHIGLGLQWGDEGKGKVIDYLSENADLVVRSAGGANAGHTIYVSDKKYVLHLVPSGIIRKNTICVLGSGMVADPEGLQKEIEDLKQSGIEDIKERLYISPGIHMILPIHYLKEKVREEGTFSIGTTRRAIGPAYETRAARTGIPLSALFHPDKLKEMLYRLYEDEGLNQYYGTEIPSVEQTLDDLLKKANFYKPMVQNTVKIVNSALKQNKNVLLEGAQGSMLDLQHGTYPFVTSSFTVAGGSLAGIGTGSVSQTKIIGISKAYATRVGLGPFPTELNNETGDLLAEKGREFGATTGRARRCGWLDLTALKYAAELSGVTELAITKTDVLTHVKEIKAATAYRLSSGEILNGYPEDPFLIEEVTPVYETFETWESTFTDEGNLHPNLLKFLAFIEHYMEVPVKLLSYGPGREDTLKLR